MSAGRSDDPMTEVVLGFRLGEIRDAARNRDGDAGARAVKELANELGPDVADQVLDSLIAKGQARLRQRGAQ